MKKYCACIILLLIAFFTTGCTGGLSEPAEKIIPPRNRQIPVAGTWEIAEVIEGGALKPQEIQEAWQGRSIEFSEDYALLGDNILEKPRYKIKRVNGEEYLLYGHKSIPAGLGLSGEELDVVTVTDEDKFLCEIIKVSSEELILEIDNSKLYIKKISDQVSGRSDIKLRETGGSPDPAADAEKGPSRTGVLVGFYSPDTEQHYRTLWIAATDKKLHPVLNTQGIFFPRRSGFWRMETYMDEFIIARPFSAEQNEDKPDGGTGSITRRICYVGNDYVSVESKNSDTGESVLQVLPIDSLPGIKEVKLSDLSGEAGAISMEEGRKRAVELLEADGGSVMGDMQQNNSFGLERKMGHWFFKGRINYRKDNKVRFMDYNINVIPPAELIFYDELSVLWTEVKDRVPEAVDVFTSPNRDIALVITKGELVIFGIKNGRLEHQPLGKVILKAGETVIMAEWATGRYVEAWENSFYSLLPHT